VLVRFNDKPVKRYGVSRSEDYTALFFSDPMGVLKAIRDNGGYMTVGNIHLHNSTSWLTFTG
jgi:hypothetical protein